LWHGDEFTQQVAVIRSDGAAERRAEAGGEFGLDADEAFSVPATLGRIAGEEVITSLARV